MNFIFSKEIIKQYLLTGYGLIKDCGLYKIYNTDILVGQFFYSEEVAFFAFDDKDIRIETEKQYLRKWKYKIIDQKQSSEIGNYEIPSWTKNNSNIGKLNFDNNSFKCKKLKPEVRYNIFKKETWGNYKIKVYNESEEVIYRLKMEVPCITGTTSAYRPFEGNIELNGTNIFLLFAGLFLLEQVFENEKISI